MESFKFNPKPGAKTEKMAQKPGNPENRESYLKSLKKHLIASILLISSFAAPEKLRAQSAKEVPSTQVTSSQAESIKEVYKKDFEEFQGLVEKEKIKEKIAFIEETFDEKLLEGFFMLHRIKSDLAILEKLNAGKDKPDVFVPQYNSQKILLSTQGLMLSEAYKERWENNKKTYKPVKFENVDSVPGLSAELVDKFLKENYPEKYITGSTDSIEFDDERMIAESGDVEVLGFTESASVGFDKPVRENGPNNIVIFDAGGEINKKTFFEILKHEVHHTNDWKTSRLLTSADRISMLYDMAKRIKESDKYTSEYLGMIDKGVIESHVDKKILKKLDLEKTINLIRATEYWPEIAKAYFENKEQFKKDHPKDYELVKKWADKMTESKGN